MTLKLHRAAIENFDCPYCKRPAGVECKKKKPRRAHACRIKLLSQSGKGAVSKSAKPSASKGARSDRFYRSWEWKEVRYEALKLHGRRCQCCGWAPGDTKTGHLVVDHIIPRKKRPDLELKISNLQVLCNDCNMGKSNIYEDDYRSFGQIHQQTIQ